MKRGLVVFANTKYITRNKSLTGKTLNDILVSMIQFIDTNYDSSF